jgi:DNA primase
LTEIHKNETQPSEVVSSLENIESAVERLSAILDGMKEMENHWKKPQEKANRVNEKLPDAEENKHPANQIKDEKPAQTPHREPKETHDETKTMRAKLQDVERTVPEAKKTERGSSRNDYYILAVALVTLGVIIFKLCSMLL